MAMKSVTSAKVHIDITEIASMLNTFNYAHYNRVVEKKISTGVTHAV